uniref:Uncharacterized protein n=1 Tax=Romanomermis culicivorax TaxID=13658 RepID=A0A915INB0_ROMCU
MSRILTCFAVFLALLLAIVLAAMFVYQQDIADIKARIINTFGTTQSPNTVAGTNIVAGCDKRPSNIL